MKMTKVLGVLLVLAMASLSYGTAISYQLTVDNAAPVESPAAHTQVAVPVGGTVTVSVYFKTDYAVTGNLALLGFDRATTSGTAAVALDGKLTSALASNVNGDFATLPQNAKAGGRATSGSRPYGVYFGGNEATGTSAMYSTWTKLGDVVITNAGVTAGNSYTVALWDNPGTSLTYETHPVAAPTTLSILNDVVVVPEPVSIVLLALGGLGLLRRKSC